MYKETKREVKITLHKGRIDYNFTGNWNGNDVRLVTTSFHRQYRLYQRSIRREASKQEVTVQVANKEVSDGR